MTSSHQPAALPAEHLAGRGRPATAAVLKRLTDQEGGPPPQGPGAVHLLTASVCWSGCSRRRPSRPGPGHGCARAGCSCVGYTRRSVTALPATDRPAALCLLRWGRGPDAISGSSQHLAPPCRECVRGVPSDAVCQARLGCGNVQGVGGPAYRVAGHGEARTPCGGPVELLAQARTRPCGPTRSRDRPAGGGPAELLHPPGCRPRARRGGCCGDPYRRRPRRTAPAQPLPGGAAAGH